MHTGIGGAKDLSHSSIWQRQTQEKSEAWLQEGMCISKRDT
jgi:hypothetical protein